MTDHHAIVLAGGTSSRMGQPKAWLSVSGTPALRVVVEQISPACERIIVVAAPGQSLPPLPRAVRRVDDPPERAGEGPLVGILTGLEALDAGPDALAYIGTSDGIFVRPAHLAQLFGLLHADPRVDAVAPVSATDEGHRLHGLASAVRAGVARDVARKLVTSGRRSVRSLHAALALRTLAQDELVVPEVLLPCNTPTQWNHALTRLHTGEEPR